MDSNLIHDALIERARMRGRPDGYVERHHIVPKSHGGSNTDSNMVWLTGREHYLIHWLLFRIHRNTSMAFAWYRMTATKGATVRYTSHTFAYARAARAAAAREIRLGKALSPDHRAKLAAAKKGRTYQEMGRSSSALKGRQITEEHRKKVVAALVGRKRTQESKRRQSEAFKGAGNPQYGRSPSVETRAKIAASVTATRAKWRALEKEMA